MPLKRGTGTTNKKHVQTSSSSSSLSDEVASSSQHSHYNDDDESLVDEEDEEDQWGAEYDELDPSDSASTSQEYKRALPRSSHSPGPLRGGPRRHRLPGTHQPYPYHAPSAPPMSADPSDEYPASYGRGGFGPAPPQTQGAFYGARPGHQSGGYAQSHAGFMPNHYSGQMVPYDYRNPFAPMAGNGANFYGDPRGYDMMPYHQGAHQGGHQGGPGFYNNGGPGYGLPAHLQHYIYNAPPPPPTEAPAPAPPTPAPPAPEKPNPEVEKLKKQLAKFEEEEKKKQQENELAELKERMARQAEEAFQMRMEEARKAAEQAKKEIEEAKREAEKAAREKLEAEKKQEEERKKLQEEAMKRIEREARERLEAELRAAEERKKREEEAKALAEAQAKARIELAIREEQERIHARLRAEEEAKAAAAAKAAEEAERLKRLEEEAKRTLEAAIKEQEEKLAAAVKAEREKMEAAQKAEEEAKAAAAKKAAEEAEWRKQLEAEAKLKAEVEAREKLEAERKAAEAAKEAEANKKKEEEALKKLLLEEARVKAEEAVKTGDKPPIKFKDAVGRKFSFPFHLCQTWQGMEDLIKQAFLHVDVIGPHVQEGHYDLIGPNGEIILPAVWEKVVEPDWAITMHMWPMDKAPLRSQQVPPGAFPPGAIPRPLHPGHHQRIPAGMAHAFVRPASARPGGGGGGGIPVPPGWAAGMPGGMPTGAHVRPGPAMAAEVVNAEPGPKSGRKSRAGPSSMLGWMAGSKPKSGSKKKRQH